MLNSNLLLEELSTIGHNPKFRTSIGHVNAIMYHKNTTFVGADKRGDNYGKLLNSN